MEVQGSFTIEEARRNRISEDTRAKYASGINQIRKWASLVGKDHLLTTTDDI